MEKIFSATSYYLNKIVRCAIVIGLINLVQVNNTFAQTIQPMSYGFNNQVASLVYDSVSNYLYASGSFKKLGPGSGGTEVNHIARWDGFMWDSLGSGADSYVISTIMYNGDLIVGGTFNNVGGVNAKGLASWNGSQWDTLADALNAFGNPCVQSFFVNGPDLYVGGCFASINGIPAQGIARFDGLNWHTYPPLNSSFHYVSAIMIYNNELYIAGNFNGGMGKSDIMKFDGTSWVTVGGGFTGANTHVYDIVEYQGKLCVTGYFQTINGDPGNNIAFWDGLSWSQPANGLVSNNVLGAYVFNNKLYVGGLITSASGINVSNIAIWDGSVWDDFHGITFNNGVISFASKNDELYLGGSFYLVNGDTMTFVARYDYSTGLENEIGSCISITPTLSIDYFYIQSSCFNEKIEVKVLNTSGQIIKYLHASSEKQVLLDLRPFPSGVYYVQIQTIDKNYNFKIMKITE